MYLHLLVPTLIGVSGWIGKTFDPFVWLVSYMWNTHSSSHWWSIVRPPLHFLTLLSNLPSPPHPSNNHTNTNYRIQKIQSEIQMERKIKIHSFVFLPQTTMLYCWLEAFQGSLCGQAWDSPCVQGTHCIAPLMKSVRRNSGGTLQQKETTRR